MAALLLTASLTLVLSTGHAETITPAPANASISQSGQAGGRQDQQLPSLVQCDVGLILPLLLVGLVTLGGRAKANKKR